MMNRYPDHLDEIVLQDYAEATLPFAQQQRVEAHLADCAHCRTRLDEVRTLLTELDDLSLLPDAPLTHDLTPAILAALTPPPAPRLPWPWLAGQLALATTLLYWMGAVGSWHLLQRLTPAWGPLAGWSGWSPTLLDRLYVARLQLTATLGGMMEPWLPFWSLNSAPSLAPDILPVWWGVIVLAAFGIWLLGNRLAFGRKNAKGEQRG